MNESRKIPGFTAEDALEQGVSNPYAGLAQSRAGGSAVELAVFTDSHVTFHLGNCTCEFHQNSGHIVCHCPVRPQ